jgi:hypothetical protein
MGPIGRLMRVNNTSRQSDHVVKLMVMVDEQMSRSNVFRHVASDFMPTKLIEMLRVRDLSGFS